MATILGLLIVVTFIANYLTTTLPNQMSVNELNHVVQVENQVGRLQALIQSATAAGVIGAELTAPVTLGSSGDPPFAPADLGTIAPATKSSTFGLTLPIGGAWSISPPKVTNLGHYASSTSGCTFTGTTTAACTGTTGSAWWNFSNSGTTTYSFSGNGGSYFVNASDSGTSQAALAALDLTLSGTGTLNLLEVGNNTTIPLTLSGQGTVNVVIYGNYDTLTITDTSGGGTVQVTEVGLHDTVGLPEAAGITFLASVYGTADVVSVTNSTAAANINANSVFSVYFVGDSPSTTSCPNDNLAATDQVWGGHQPVVTMSHFHTTYTSYGDYNVTYNVTSTPIAFSHNPWVTNWAWTAFNPSANNTVAPTIENCPDSVQASTPLGLGEVGGAFAVHLYSTYVPQADVAFDEGAVVYAQEGGIPVMVDGPELSMSMNPQGAVTSISMIFPVFVGPIPSESGISTTDIAVRLLSIASVSLVTSNLYTFAVGSQITLTIVSPFAAAWAGYFNATSPFENDWACTGPSVACVGPYNSGGPVGTVTLSIPTTSALQSIYVQVPTFALSVV